MPRQAAVVSQHAFNRGEISPDLYGRKDWPPVYKGMERALNVIVRPTGGAIKAPGTMFVAEALEQRRPERLIPFEFGSEQTYILEFGHMKFRIIHDGGLVVYPEGHEKAGEIVVLDSPFTIDQMQSLEIRVDAGKRSVDYAQENDTLILVHAAISPKILTRFDHHDWRWSEFAPPPLLDPPLLLKIDIDGGKQRSYIVTATGADAGGVAVESYPSNEVTTEDNDSGDGITTLSWEPVTGATGYRVYRNFETSTGWEYRGIGNVSGGEIMTFTDNNVTSGNSNRPPRAKNPFYSTGKYPSIAQFDRNRLWLGAPSAQPNQINGSRLGEFKNFDINEEGDEEVDASDACEWLLTGGNKTPTLLWMASHKDGMVMGSPDVEYIMQGNEPAIDPQISPQSYYGGTAIKPILFNNSIITVSATRRSVLAWAFNFVDSVYNAKDLSAYSMHIFLNKRVMANAAQRTPENNLFSVLSDGTVAITMFEPREDALGVTRRETDGRFETCESISNIDGVRDVYFQTVRTINGVEKRFIERMAQLHFPDMPIEDAWYVDCGIEYRGEPKKTFTGLGHLEGKRISVLADGVPFGVEGREIVVKNGGFSIPMAAGRVIAGLPYMAEIKTLDLGPQGAEPATRNRAPVDATISFWHTADCKYACEGSKEYPIKFFDREGETTSLKTIVSKTVSVPSAPLGSISSSLTLRSYSPLPWGVNRVDMVMMISQKENKR